MTQRTREPIAKRHEGKGSMTQTGTVTKLQNKIHENKNMKQTPKQTLQFPLFHLSCHLLMILLLIIVFISVLLNKMSIVFSCLFASFANESAISLLLTPPVSWHPHKCNHYIQIVKSE